MGAIILMDGSIRDFPQTPNFIFLRHCMKVNPSIVIHLEQFGLMELKALIVEGESRGPIITGFFRSNFPLVL